jgi:hypothetical protein
MRGSRKPRNAGKLVVRPVPCDKFPPVRKPVNSSIDHSPKSIGQLRSRAECSINGTPQCRDEGRKLRAASVPKKSERLLINAGTKIGANDLVTRDRRPPFTTAHVADSQRSFGPAVQKQALAHDSQRRRSRSRVSASCRSLGIGVGARWGFAQRQRLENTICQTPLRLTPGIVARSSKRSAKDYGRQ